VSLPDHFIGIIAAVVIMIARKMPRRTRSGAVFS